MSADTHLRAALYCRISDDPHDLQAGVERQKKDCRAYAERQGWTVVDVFEDNDTSAYRGKKRKDYHRLDRRRAVPPVRRRRRHPRRRHRDVMEYFEFVKLLKSTGIAWHTAMEGEIRFSSATDEATSSVRAVFNQLDRRSKRAHPPRKARRSPRYSITAESVATATNPTA